MDNKIKNNISYKNINPEKNKTTLANHFFILPGVVFILAFLIFPLLYNLVLSFKDVTLLNLKSGSKSVGISNYIEIFSDPVFYISLKNTAIFTVASIFFQFVIGFALALGLNKNFPGRNVFRALLLLGWMIPIIITGTIYKWMFSGDTGVFNFILEYLGLIDSSIYWLTSESFALLGVTIANIWIGIPFNMLILLAGLQGLPKQLYEAAKIDGASKLKQFIFITLPLMRPSILILLMRSEEHTSELQSRFDLVCRLL